MDFVRTMVVVEEEVLIPTNAVQMGRHVVVAVIREYVMISASVLVNLAPERRVTKLT
jgi:hypothetical protein